MARKINRPALYELSRSKLEPTVEEGDNQSVRSPGELELSRTHWLAPGVGIRVPGGFLVVAGLVLVGSIIGAWLLGYSSGVTRTEAMMAANPEGVLHDPLLTMSLPPIKEALESNPEAVKSSQSPFTDPQRPWHFVLAETNQEGAERLAEFCQLKGLEVMVIPRHNTGLARVIALPGMTSSSRQVSEVKAQDQLIAVLGRQWKQNGGRTDFSDRYMDRIEPVLD